MATKPVSPELVEIVATLKRRRSALESAESDVGQIPELLKGTGDRQASLIRAGGYGTLEDRAQTIRDRLNAARMDLQDSLQDLRRAVGIRAVQDPTARVILEQLERLSSYPSAREADQALALLSALETAGQPVWTAAERSGWKALDSLALQDPTDAARRLLAEILVEAFVILEDNFKTAAAGMGVSEKTLMRLRQAESVKPESWRAAVRYVRRARSKRDRTG